MILNREETYNTANDLPISKPKECHNAHDWYQYNKKLLHRPTRHPVISIYGTWSNALQLRITTICQSQGIEHTVARNARTFIYVIDVR